MEFDPKTERLLSQAYPDIAQRWRRTAALMAEAHGMQIKVSDGFRSFKEQWDKYKIGRTRKAGIWVVTGEIKTRAAPGLSKHNYGLAFDSCFAGPDPYLMGYPKSVADVLWDDYGQFARKFGLEWGGDWKPNPKEPLVDLPHVEISYGLSNSDLQKLFSRGGIAAVWAKCDDILTCGGETEWKRS